MERRTFSHRRVLVPFLIVACAAGVAGGELLWDNEIEFDGFSAFPISPPLWPDWRWVDDIEVGEPGWMVTAFAYHAMEDDTREHSGTSEIYVYSDDNAEPGDLFKCAVVSDIRIPTGLSYFGRLAYKYRVHPMSMFLPPGSYWIGVRDSLASGEGTNAILSSDGGENGGCPPEHPQGTCESNFVSTDAGATWGGPAGEFLAFEVHGLLTGASGDPDEDGDIDLFDFAAFDNCVTGPGGGVHVACLPFDFDGDDDIDFTDFQVMQIVFTGGSP